MPFLELASLILQAGPAAIRGISSLFGDSNAAEHIASVVEDASEVFDSLDDKKAVIADKLAAQPEHVQRCYSQMQLALEKELTFRKKNQMLDAQLEQQETQKTIKSGDKSPSNIVRIARPLIAVMSAASGFYYLIATPQPDMTITTTLFSFAAAYMGLRHIEKAKGIEL